MIFRNKTAPEPKVEFFTAVPGLAESYPVKPARGAIPDWFKSSVARVPRENMGNAHAHPPVPLPPGANPQPPPPPPPPRSAGPTVGPPTFAPDENPTIKSCPGVIDVLRSGYIVRAWADIEIVTPEPPAPGTGRDRYMDRVGMQQGETGAKVGSFPAPLNQAFPLQEGEYDFALKLDSPWTCRTPPGWSLLYLPLPYDVDKPWRVVPGVTDNDEFHVVNIIAMWRHYGTYLIEAGTPLCWLLPVKREGFSLKVESHFDAEMDRQLRTRGKGGVGAGGRLVHGTYLLERARRRREGA